jgi:hypothetical protein
VLATKNSLTAADTKLVEDAFEQRLAGLLEPVTAEAATCFGCYPRATPLH